MMARPGLRMARRWSSGDQLVAVVEPGRGGEREALPAVHRHRLQAPLRGGETPGLAESRAALRPLAEPIAAEVPKRAGHGAKPGAADLRAVSADDTVDRAQTNEAGLTPSPNEPGPLKVPSSLIRVITGRCHCGREFVAGEGQEIVSPACASEWSESSAMAALPFR